MDDLAARVLQLAGAGERHRQDFGARARTQQIDRRVLHRDLRAEVAVDPLDRGVLVGDRALGDQVVDVVRPVLDGRVADVRAGLAINSTTAECSESDEYVGAVQPSM